MTQATSNEGQVPAPNSGIGFELSGATEADDVKTDDNDWGAIIHAIVMCIAFVIIFPLGAILLRLIESVRWHSIIQFIAMVVAIVGTGTGLYVSFQYNRSRDVSSAHQIIGILVFLGVIVQFALGFIHHRMYKKYQRPTWLGKTHLFLGPAVLIIGIINAPLGFNLARKGTTTASRLLLRSLIEL